MTREPGAGVWTTRAVETRLGQYMPNLLVTVVHDNGTGTVVVCADNGYPHETDGHQRAMPCQLVHMPASALTAAAPRLPSWQLPGGYNIPRSEWKFND